MSKVIARKPIKPIRPEPIDPPSPSGPDYPYVWYPDVALNLYGFNQDLNNWPGVREMLKGALEGALAGIVPGAVVDVQIVLDYQFPGRGTPFCLSIGAWLQALGNPNDQGALDARRRGLFAIRKENAQPGNGDLLLSFAAVDQMIRRLLLSLPASLPAGAPALTLSGIGVMVTPPASITISTFLSTAVPVLGALNHFVSMLATFEKTAQGNIRVRVANILVSGDFLLSTIDAVAFMPLFAPPLQDFSLREISIGGPTLSLDYKDPLIERRGQREFVSGQESIVFPFNWQFVNRTRSLSVDGPNKVVITGARRVASYRAITELLVNPTFTWKLDGQVQPGLTGPNASFTFLASSIPPAGTVTRRIEVIATEPGMPPLSAVRRTIVQLPVDP